MKYAASREKGSSDSPSNQHFSTHAQPLSQTTGLVLWLTFPLAQPPRWAIIIGSGETVRMCMLAWTFSVGIWYNDCFTLSQLKCLAAKYWQFMPRARKRLINFSVNVLRRKFGTLLVYFAGVLDERNIALSFIMISHVCNIQFSMLLHFHLITINLVITFAKIDMNRNVRKRIFGHVCPAKIQFSLRIRADWSESLLGAFCDSIAKDEKIFTWITKNLIRLRGWANWFESSLGAHVSRYDFSLCGWFCSARQECLKL